MNAELRRRSDKGYDVLVEGAVVGRVWSQRGRTDFHNGRIDVRSTATGWRYVTHGKHDYGDVMRSRANAVTAVLRDI